MADALVPKAAEFAKQLALVEAEDAAREAKKHDKDEADKKALLDHLRAPSGVSDEEAIKRALKIIEGAVKNRRTEVQIYRFPNQLCTDRGRAINQQEPDWESTLTGVPKEIYDLWQRQFKDKGYRLRVEIVDFSGGVPGDIGMTLAWG